MRSSVLRLAGTLAVCVLAISFTGCGSNNTGKLVGKWKMVSTSKAEELESMKKLGLALAWDFKADGTFAMEVVPAEDGKEASPLAAMFDKSKLPTGKYTLSFGDKVNFTDVTNSKTNKPMTTDITIVGDNMTMKDPDGTTMQCVRIK